MRRAVSGLGLIVAPYTLSMRVRIAVHLNFGWVIGAGIKSRHGNVAGQEVREPGVVRVLVCMNEDCHREIGVLFDWRREKGPHPRSVDAANVSEGIYTRYADRLTLFDWFRNQD